jgi:hypothetical protein
MPLSYRDIEVEVAKLQTDDAGEFYGALVKAGYRTSRFEDIYNFTVRRDGYLVSLVGGETVIKKEENA